MAYRTTALRIDRDQALRERIISAALARVADGGFAALTMGREKQHYFTARIDHGKEGYLPTGAITSFTADGPGTTSTTRYSAWPERNGYSSSL